MFQHDIPDTSYVVLASHKIIFLIKDSFQSQLSDPHGLNIQELD